MRDLDHGFEAVERIHSVCDALKEIKTAHDQAAAIVLKAEARAADCGHSWCHPGVHHTADQILQTRLLLNRVRVRITQRLFAEMDRAMKAVEQ